MNAVFSMATKGLLMAHQASSVPLPHLLRLASSANPIASPFGSIDDGLAELAAMREPYLGGALISKTPEGLEATVRITEQPAGTLVLQAKPNQAIRIDRVSGFDALQTPLVRSQMMDTLAKHDPVQKAKARHTKQLMQAPELVFLTIAAADGLIDDQERAAFKRWLTQPANISEPMAKWLTQWHAQDMDLATLGGELHQDMSTKLALLRQAIEACFSPEEAQAYKQDLLNMGHTLAEASGGFLGFKRVSGAEKQALTRLEDALMGS